MFVGFRSLGWSVGSLEAISAARGAASGVYAIIDAVSSLLYFKKLHFSYDTECLGLNIFYSSQDMKKDRAEQKAMFSPQVC